MGAPVPNEVFLRTRAGLTALVSSRAAGRILEGALKGSGHNPEDVNLPQMRSALLGPVMHELEGVLPRAGLRRNLERLARSLRSASGTVAGPQVTTEDTAPLEQPYTGTDEPESDSETAAGARAEAAQGHDAAGETDSGRAVGDDAEGADAEGDDTEAGDSETGRPAAEPARVRAVAADPAPAPVSGAPERGPLATEDLERHVQRFAQIEHVRLVSVIRRDGSVAVSRGDGPDPELLARFSRLALTLLAKGGAIRQFHLGHTGGQLFLYPLGHDLLVIVGGVELNLGTITTAFTALALEEDL
ncbi:MAG: hypothetical protein WD314_00220 [Trueperaceae bacterium]